MLAGLAPITGFVGLLILVQTLRTFARQRELID